MTLIHPLLCHLTEEQLGKIKIFDFDTNQVIFNEGGICSSVGFVLDGEIIISTISVSGREEYFAVLKENDTFGNVLVFSENPLYLGDVIAKRKSRVALLSKSYLLKFMTENKQFLAAYLGLLCDETLAAKKDRKMLLQKTISDRLLFYIQENGGSITISSITDLAKKLSYPRPSLSRTINCLIDDGVLELINKELRIIK